MAYERLLMPWEQGSEVVAFKRNKMLGDRFPWKLPFVTYYWDAREGVTAASERVSAWVDRKAGVSLAQGTGANQPLILPYSGTNYLWLPGAESNYASSPDSVPLSITGDIDIRVLLALDDWTPAALSIFIAKDANNGSNRSWDFYVNTSGTLEFAYSNDGTNLRTATSSAATGFTNGTQHWLRCTYNTATGKVNFYTSDDGVAWSSLGTEQSVTAGAIYDGNAQLQISGNSAIGSLPMSGKVYRAQIYSGIGGTLVFDANFTAVSEGATTFTESSSNGATVTINSTGSKPAQIVGSQQLLGDGAAHFMQTANMTLNQPVTAIMVLRPNGYAGGANRCYLSGKQTDSVFLYNVAGGSNIATYAGGGAVSAAAPASGAYYVFNSVLNGDNSGWGYNLNAVNAGVAGPFNPGGLSIFSDSAGANFGPAQIKSFALCNTALSTAQLRQLINAINFQHRVF